MTAIVALALSVVAFFVVVAVVERVAEWLRLAWEGLEHRRTLRDARVMFDTGAREDYSEGRAA